MNYLHSILDLVIDYYPFFELLLLSLVVLILIINLIHQQQQIHLLKEEIKELKWFED